MPAPVDEVVEALKTFNKAIDGVIKHPLGPARWRAANNLWLSLSEKNRRIYQEVCEDNRITRDSVNKFGFAPSSEKKGIGNSDHTLRESLNIPAGAYIAIAKADPTAFTLQENAPKMFKEFKEYTTRSAY